MPSNSNNKKLDRGPPKNKLGRRFDQNNLPPLPKPKDGFGLGRGVAKPVDSAEASPPQALSTGVGDTDHFSPGKTPEADSAIPSIDDYATSIAADYRQGVECLLRVATNCADANARLLPAKKAELLRSLPFGEPTFRKFVQIGDDARLQAPEVQRLRPPAYTTMYAITLLDDGELKQAVEEEVIRPDMKRQELQNWRKARRVVPGSSESKTVPATVAGCDNREVASGDHPEPEREASASNGTTAEPRREAATDLNDNDVTPAASDRPLSAEDKRAIKALTKAWENASERVRSLFKKELGLIDLGDWRGQTVN